MDAKTLEAIKDKSKKGTLTQMDLVTVLAGLEEKYKILTVDINQPTKPVGVGPSQYLEFAPEDYVFVNLIFKRKEQKEQKKDCACKYGYQCPECN